MFQETAIDRTAPPNVAQFVRDYVDIHLQDVHAMFRLPLPEVHITAGCNFAISAVLLSVISGLSVTLYKKKKGNESGQLFKELAERFYPWDTEPSGALTDQAGAECLYRRFRNPLVHSLGSDSDVSIARRSGGRSEDELEQVEKSTRRPTSLQAVATLKLNPGGQEMLNVDCFYWGVRELVTRLTADSTLMQPASGRLKLRGK